MRLKWIAILLGIGLVLLILAVSLIIWLYLEDIIDLPYEVSEIIDRIFRERGTGIPIIVISPPPALTATAEAMRATIANLPTPIPSPTPAPMVPIRLVHLGTGIGPVDIYLDDRLIAQGLPYTYNTGYADVGAGQHVVRVVSAGSPPDIPPLAEAELSLEPAQAVTAAFMSRGDERQIVLFDDPDEPLPAYMARIVLINATDMRSLSLRGIDGEPLVGPAEHGEEDDAELWAGKYDLWLFSDGEPTDFRLEGEVLEGNRVYTFMLAGSEDDLQLVRLEAYSEPMAYLRIAHVADTVRGLDFYVDGELRAQLDYQGATEYIPVEPGPHTVRGYARDAAPGEAPILMESSLGLADDQAVTLVAVDTLDGVDMLVFDDDTSPTSRDGARLTFANTIPDAPAFNVLENGQVVDDMTLIPFREEGPTVELDAGVHDLQAVQPDSLVVMADMPAFNLAAGRSYLVLVTGDWDNEPQMHPVIVDAEVGREPLGPHRAMIRLVHAAYGLPPLDFYLGDRRLVYRLEFDRGTKYITVSLDSLHLSAVSSGGDPDAEAIWGTELPIAEGEAVTVYLIETDEGADAVVSYDAPEPLSGQMASLRLISLVPEVEAVSLRDRRTLRMLIEGVPYAQLSEPMYLRAADYNFLDVVSAVDGSLVTRLGEMSLDGGVSYTWVVIGHVGGEPTPHVVQLNYAP